MNAIKNSVQLIGHVGIDPEFKIFEDGNKIANLTMATNEIQKNKNGEKIEKTDWHRIVARGHVAEIIEKYVTKGKEIAVQGKLTYRNYEDKNGEKRYITEIFANEILLLGKP